MRRHQREPEFGIDEPIDEILLLPRDRPGFADDWIDRGQDRAGVWSSAVPAHPFRNVAAKRLHVWLCVLQGEDHLGPARGKVSAARRGACLHDDWMPLRRTRDG